MLREVRTVRTSENLRDCAGIFVPVEHGRHYSGYGARAAMDGRAMPDLDDVVAMAMPVLAHRVVLNFQAEAEGVSATKVVAGLPTPSESLRSAQAWCAHAWSEA